jgi:hypothetical protein
MRGFYKAVWFAGVMAMVTGAQTETQVTGWRMQDSTTIPALTGQTISGAAYDASSWLTAIVPGTVLQTYVNAGTYPNPDYGENMVNMVDLAAQNHRYWFRGTFSLSAAAGQRVWLKIPGINYHAMVFLNGNYIDTMFGAFQERYFDITGIANLAGANYLAIRIRGPYHPGVYHTKQSGNCGPNGGTMSQDGPTFMATQGWDWIPTVSDRSMGIWKPVSVRVVGPVRLSHPWIRTTNVSASSATVPLQVTLLNTSAASVTGTLAADIDGSQSFTSQIVTVNANDSQKIWFPNLTMTNPTLWWPNGYGPQNLHTCHVSFTPISSAVSDTCVFNFGVRQFSGAGSPLILSCNGQRILCRGGNMGMDDMMKRYDMHKLENRIRYHKEMNFNIVRDWLGATDCEEFYSFCDQYGLMVWTDMYEPHSADQPTAIWCVNNTIANMRDKMLRTRNHACVALWCCRNETAATAAFWTALQAMGHEVDSNSRYVLESSGLGPVHSGGPYTWSNVSNNGVNGFHTELGAPTVPSYETMNSFLPTANQWPMGNTWWAFHDYCAGNGSPVNYTNAMTAIWGAATNIQDCCKKGQLMNYDEYRSFFESLQSKRFNGATGLLLWMSNPVWPSTMWQTYDYYMEGTGAMYGSQHGAEPIHIMYYGGTNVQVINNTTAALSNYSATASTYNLNGVRAWTNTATVNVAADAMTNVFGITAGSSTPYFLDLKLKDGSGNLVSHNFYWLPANGSSTSGMMTMVSASNVVAVPANPVWTKSGNENTLTFKLVNNSTVVAVAMRLLLTQTTGMTGPRILPVHYNDNYFSLIPGDTQSVAVKFDEVDRAGANPVLCLTGINVPQQCFIPTGVIYARRSTPTDQGEIKTYISFVGSKMLLNDITAGGVWQVTIFNMQGRMVLEAEGVVKGSGAMVSISRLRPGAYIAMVIAGKKQLHTMFTVLGTHITEGR